VKGQRRNCVKVYEAGMSLTIESRYVFKLGGTANITRPKVSIFIDDLCRVFLCWRYCPHTALLQSSRISHVPLVTWLQRLVWEQSIQHKLNDLKLKTIKKI